MVHLVNNIVDVTIYDNNDPAHYSFMRNIIAHSNETVFKCAINNRCVNNELLIYINKNCAQRKFSHFIHKLPKLLVHLNKTSLYKYKGYYNLEQYHYMIPIMLFVTRVQTILPKCVIKCLIIPFIYR